MGRFRAKAFAGICALLTIALLSGCGGKANKVSLIGGNVLTVCTSLPYKPFEFDNGREIVGFEVDLVKEIGKKLGVTTKVIAIPFDQIADGSALDRQACDLTTSAMTITEERAKKMDFSVPYFNASQVLATDRRSPIARLSDMDGKRLGVQQSTTGEDYAKVNAPKAQLHSFPDFSMLRAALLNGQVDAILSDNGVVLDLVRYQPDLKVVDNRDTGERYGMAVRKGNSALLEVTNTTLSELRANGQYQTIYKNWFGDSPSAGS